MSHNSIISSNITLIRKSRNLTDVRVAQRLRITVGEYRLYELGCKELSAHLFIELARFYKVKMEYLISEHTTKVLSLRVERMEQKVIDVKRYNDNLRKKEFLNKVKLERFEKEPCDKFY